MNKHELQTLLASNGLVRRFYCYDELDSTMSQARRLTGAARDTRALHGTLVLADHQSTGRGRHGRQWDAPPGTSVLASVILSREELPGQENAAQLPLLAAVLPVAVCRGIHIVLPAARVKYPNDIVHEGRKLSGILLEVQGQTVIAGFGINCGQTLADFPTNLKTPATSLLLETGKQPSREAITAEVLHQLEKLLSPDSFLSAGEKMRDLCDTLGQNVMLELIDGEVVAGVAKTITPEGSLLLETGAGVRQILTSQVIRTWNSDSEMLTS